MLLAKTRVFGSFTPHYNTHLELEPPPQPRRSAQHLPTFTTNNQKEMTSQFTQFNVSDPIARASTPTSTAGGKARGSAHKRGRKARGPSTTASPAIHAGDLGPASVTTEAQWPMGATLERGGTPTTLVRALAEQITSNDIQARRGTPSGSRAGSVLHSAAPGEAGPSRIGASTVAEDDGEGEDDLLPDMADDDYSAQLSWQSQSKDNLKCVSPVFLDGSHD